MTNEKRLIDANALKQLFDKRESDDIELYGGVHIVECFPADDAKEMVDQMPTVDAVEVVRCKDCKHFIQEEHGCNHFGYYSHTPWVDEVDFCSYGERRDNERKAD